MATSLQIMTFQNAFSWMKMYKLRLKFHWGLFLRVYLTISQHWFRLWLGANQATSHYMNQWWLVYFLPQICITQPQWVKWCEILWWWWSIVLLINIPDSKAHGANMGPTWGLQDPGVPHVGPMNFCHLGCPFDYNLISTRGSQDHQIDNSHRIQQQ